MKSGNMERYTAGLEQLQAEMRLRRLPRIQRRSGPFVKNEGLLCLNLSSNDYLGLATDRQVLQNFYARLDNSTLIENYAPGSSASRLMPGGSGCLLELENALCTAYGRDALVFNSGYHANIGILPALVTRKDLILADRACHASIIDGIRLAGCRFMRYAHLDYEHCRHLLRRYREKFDQIFIVTESLFSMDGDTADLRELTDIRNSSNSILYVDEAHAVGVCGKNGLGLSEETDTLNSIDILVGTFGKAFAGMGAYVILNRTLKQWLVNRMRSFIFSTALPPVVATWNLTMLRAMPRFEKRRTALKNLTGKLRNALKKTGITAPGSHHIIPIITGRDSSAVSIAEYLRNNGFLCMPIRPPTVPEGLARVRISLSASMQWKHLSGLPKVIAFARTRLEEDAE